MSEASIAYNQYSKFLDQLGRAELPLAARGTLNQLAFETRKRLSTVEMPKEFMLRNNFENKHSLHYESAGGTLDIDEMVSSTGQSETVRFKRGPAKTKDLYEQEFGVALPPRKGKKLRRTPTKAARISGSAARIVRKEFQPSRTVQWIGLRRIERLIAERNGKKGTRLPKMDDLQMRQRRAIAGLIRQNYKDPFILKDKKGNSAVYVLKKKKVVKIHTLQSGSKAIQARKTLEPAAKTTLNKTGEFFVQQADRRFKAAAKKFLKA